MDTPKIIEQSGARVLTTAQLAESYGTDNRRISENFNRNKNRFALGKHYFSLEGQEKHDFLNHTQIEDGSKNASVLYLWTEKGAWLHAKSLNTDQAWEAYEMLVDDYYNVKQLAVDTSQLSPELQMFQKIFNSVAEQQLEQKRLEQKMKETEQKVNNISEIVALNSRDWRKDVNKILNNIAIKLGGFEQYQKIRNESYEILEQRANADLSRRLHNRKKNLALEGVAKSKINNASKLDVIDADKRLLEIYLAVVKEMAIKYQVEIEVTV